MSLDERAETRPLPPPAYVLSTSGQFEGDDGKWSTFYINIGDSDASGSGQNFRVLPSTSSPNILIPRQAEWCVADCPKRRGIGLLSGQQPNGADSKVWKEKGIFQIPTPWGWSAANMTDTWTTTPSGQLGTDYVGLDETSKISQILVDQYVFRHTSKDFFFASLGLAVGSFGPPGASQPNFLDNLQGAKNPVIASKSYAYTAGAYYRNNNNGIVGSLVLGGYDKSRMAGPGVSIEMPNDRNNTLALGVQSITWEPDQNKEANEFSMTRESGPFSAIIDSTLPYMILPDAVCESLAARFQSVYDEDLKLYTINTSAHDWNVGQDAKVTFSITPGVRDSAEFASITLPYAALDHNLSSPIMDASMRYLPIKRSTDGVYVLGRTFLQEAYLIVDYERTNFTVAPAYSQTEDIIGAQDLVTIFNTTYQLNRREDVSGGGLSPGAIAGIVVGIILAFLLVGVGVILHWRKKRRAQRQATGPAEIDTMFAGAEVKHRRVSELTGSDSHLSPKDTTFGYFGDPKLIPPISEMSPESTPAELYSPPADGDREIFEHFGNGRVRRRGATRDRDSSGHNTPCTPVAELPGDNIRSSSGERRSDYKHTRGPSDTSLSTNIDGVLADQRTSDAQGQHPADHTDMQSPSDGLSPSGNSGQVNSLEHTADAGVERRPSHTRGLSDTTIQSDSTAVSQPTPEELERWARSPAEDRLERPMSP